MTRPSRTLDQRLRSVIARSSVVTQSLWPRSGPIRSTEQWTTGLFALTAAIRSDGLSTSTVDEFAEASVAEPTVGSVPDSSTAVLARRSARKFQTLAMTPGYDRGYFAFRSRRSPAPALTWATDRIGRQPGQGSVGYRALGLSILPPKATRAKDKYKTASGKAPSGKTQKKGRESDRASPKSAQSSRYTPPIPKDAKTSPMPPAPEPAEFVHPGPTKETSEGAEVRSASPEPTPGGGRDSSSRKWIQRADGDRRTRTRLLIDGEGVVVLSDRRVPGTRSSIKRIAVSSGGVFVIDAKHYKGLVHIKRTGPVWDLGPQELHVGRRNCTPVVENMCDLANVVRAALETATWDAEVPVHAVLCLTRAEWSFASAVEVNDVYVAWPRLVKGRVQAPGVIGSPAVQEVAQMIAEHLPVA
jgi:hypothetical protein